MKKIFPSCLFCLVAYFMAMIALSPAVFPHDAFALFGECASDAPYWFHLLFAAAFAVIGGILHVVFYRWNPEWFDVRSFRCAGIGMFAVMSGLLVLSFILSRTTELPANVLKENFDGVMRATERCMIWLTIGGMGLVAVCVGLYVVHAIVMIKFHPTNRMVKKMNEGDLAGAIRIGEACPPETRHFATTANLAVAYARASQRDKAEELLRALKQTEGIPKYCTAETVAQMLDLVRNAIAEAASTTDSRESRE